jgi:hypothetical protein
LKRMEINIVSKIILFPFQIKSKEQVFPKMTNQNEKEETTKTQGHSETLRKAFFKISNKSNLPIRRAALQTPQ